MAEHRIRTVFLWKGFVAGSGSAGTTVDSDPIDLRDKSVKGNYSVSYTVGTAGGVATCGSAKLSYLGCPIYGGTYIAPTNGTFATLGNAGGSNIVSITPPVMPFMKVRATIGTSGTSLVTAALHVQ
jgi:hypothetical protein